MSSDNNLFEDLKKENVDLVSGKNRHIHNVMHGFKLSLAIAITSHIFLRCNCSQRNCNCERN
jgi:hypothetical protein